MDLRRALRRASLRKLGGSRGRRAFRPRLDGLEPRALLATVSVNAGQVVRAVNANLLGVNLVEWDSALNTAQTKQLVQAAGLTMFRFPGGSASDDFHFNTPPAYNGQGTDASIASFIGSVNGVGVATLDYGSGSPQEAAAFLAYLNAPVGDTTPIGTGGEWVDSTSSYQQVNWQSAGYWAGLRAAAPLAKDDGLNFLRLNHPSPFNIHYWEVGNEEYGSWEADRHGQGADPGAPHDPSTYVTFARQFQAYAATISPTISIGIDAGGPTAFNNWVGNVLQQSAAQGLSVGFISDHNYVQAPGSESDSTLLLHTVSDPNNQDPSSPDDWALRASGYQALLNQDLGASGKNVELMATEFNSVYSNPGKQTTSLVNGLFVADSLGSLLETPYDGADVWDLRNYYDNSNNNSANLYGWRTSGDYGILGSSNGSAPGSGSYVPYPTYFAEQLGSKIVQAGGQVVQATSNDPNLSTYAVLEPSGHLDLLVINKSASGALTGQFQVAGFTPSSQAQSWQYGEAQDTAQSQTTDGHSALLSSTPTLSIAGSGFSSSFPAYSMTVLDLTPATVATVSDPGFEAIPIGPGQFAYGPSGSAWTFAPNGAGVSGNNSGFTSGSPNAPQGSQVAFIQQNGAITQTIAGWAAGNLCDLVPGRPAGQSRPLGGGLRGPGRRQRGRDLPALDDLLPGLHHRRIRRFERVAYHHVHGTRLRRRGQHGLPRRRLRRDVRPHPTDGTHRGRPGLRGHPRRPGGLQLQSGRLVLGVRQLLGGDRQQLRVHLGEPQRPPGLAGRLPPGEWRDHPDHRRVGRGLLCDLAPGRPARELRGRRGLRGAGRRGRRRHLPADQHVLSGLHHFQIHRDRRLSRDQARGHQQPGRG